MTGAPIIRLGFAGLPRAISLTVGAVVVPALKRQRWCWLISHVLKKGPKGVPPAIADRNSAAAVVRKMSGISVETPILHVEPCSVFRCYLPPRALAVRAIFKRQKSRSEATTALCSAIPEGIFAHGLFPSTKTGAFRKSRIGEYHRKTAKRGARQESKHRNN